MKQHILPAIRITLVCLFVFLFLYPAAIWLVAKAAPAQGKGETVVNNNNIVGYKLEGQKFTDDKYFNSRPSAVDYNAAGSAGSNKGPSNPDYLQVVKDRIDTFLVHNQSVKKENIPAELVTASGSGLDPDLSPDAAFVQVDRIASVRKLPVATIQNIIKQNTQSPLLGIAGPAKVNVLALNVALDNLK